jgi:hypothetical protein
MRRQGSRRVETLKRSRDWEDAFAHHLVVSQRRDGLPQLAISLRICFCPRSISSSTSIGT